MDKTLDDIIAVLQERGIQLPKGAVRIGCFGDSEALSESLIGLILAGSKRATRSLLWSYEFDGDAVPKLEDIEIVLDWHVRAALNVRPRDCFAHTNIAYTPTINYKARGARFKYSVCLRPAIKGPSTSAVE